MPCSARRLDIKWASTHESQCIDDFLVKDLFPFRLKAMLQTDPRPGAVRVLGNVVDQHGQVLAVVFPIGAFRVSVTIKTAF